MSSDLDIGVILSIVRETVTNEKTVRELTEKINKAVREAKEEKAAEKEEAGPRGKNKFVVLVPTEDAAKKFLEAGAYIVQIPEDTEDTSILQKDLIGCAAYQNNQKSNKKSNRGRKSKGGPIKSWPELFRSLKPKSVKECDSKRIGKLGIKTKEAVEVQVIPTGDIQF